MWIIWMIAGGTLGAVITSIVIGQDNIRLKHQNKLLLNRVQDRQLEDLMKGIGEEG